MIHDLEDECQVARAVLARVRLLMERHIEKGLGCAQRRQLETDLRQCLLQQMSHARMPRAQQVLRAAVRRLAPADAVQRDQLVLVLAQCRANRGILQTLLARACPVHIPHLVRLEHLVHQWLPLERVCPRKLDHMSHSVHTDDVPHLLLQECDDSRFVAHVDAGTVQRYADHARRVELVVAVTDSEVVRMQRDLTERCVSGGRSGGGGAARTPSPERLRRFVMIPSIVLVVIRHRLKLRQRGEPTLEEAAV
eukprot:3869367-Prymnesium_polylepis.1